MTAAQALNAARAANIAIRIDGDDLILEASAPPQGAVVDLLSRHKIEVMGLLRTNRDGWSNDDWQTSFEERAGIAEFDGCQTVDEWDDEFSSDVSALLKAVAENPQCHSFYLAGEKVRLEASRPLPGEVRPQVRRLKPDVTEYLAGLRIMDGVAALLTGRPERELTAARQAVTAFVDNHLEAARCIGWSDLELFGCYPDREVARNRYDYAGAVIMAAMSGQAIERVTELAAHYENGLVYYRKRPLPADAVPVWEL